MTNYKYNAEVLKTKIQEAKHIAYADARWITRADGPVFNMAAVATLSTDCEAPLCMEGWCRWLAHGNCYGSFYADGSNTRGAEEYLGLPPEIAHRLCFNIYNGGVDGSLDGLTADQACAAIDQAMLGHPDPWRPVLAPTQLVDYTPEEDDEYSADA